MCGYLEKRDEWISREGRWVDRGYLERKLGGYLERKMGGYRFCKIVHEDSAQVCLFSLLEGGWGAYMDLRNGRGEPPFIFGGGRGGLTGSLSRAH